MTKLTWRALNAQLMDMTEAEVRQALAAEKRRPDKRSTVLRRLHMRLCVLRRERERKEQGL